MLSYLKYFIIIYSILISIGRCDTNNINYIDLPIKELAHEKLENMYFLNIKETPKTKIILIGENIIDYNHFNIISHVKTYTTFKIQF